MRILPICVAAVCLSLAGKASAELKPLVDNFDSNPTYQPLPPLHAIFPWPKVTWSFSSATNNVTNTIVPSFTPIPGGGLEPGRVLAIQSPAKGKFILSRSDVQGSFATYSIRFFDNGSQDLGEMFQIFDPSGHWIGVGVNDNVARGKYFCRTDETRATPIAQPRTANDRGWHTLQITVRSAGSSCQVDGVDNGMVDANVQSVDTVRLQGDWDKPAHTVWVDDFTITPLFEGNRMVSGLNPGTVVTSLGYLTNPFGDDNLSTYQIGVREVAALYANSAWAAANPERNAIIQRALHQVKTAFYGLTNNGACGVAAQNLYDGGEEWCSEFVRQMYLPTVSNSINYCAIDSPLACVHRVYVRDVDEVSDFMNIFLHENGLFYSSQIADIQPFNYPGAQPITFLTVQPGDWVTVPGGDGNKLGHSALVVGVTDDFKIIYTMEGNFTGGLDNQTPSEHCVRFNQRFYYPNGMNGPLNKDIDAIGKVDHLFH